MMTAVSRVSVLVPGHLLAPGRFVLPLLTFVAVSAWAAWVPGQSCKYPLVPAAPLSILNNTPLGTANLGSLPRLLHAGSQQNVYSAVRPGEGRELVRVAGSAPSAAGFDIAPGLNGSDPRVQGEFPNGAVLVAAYEGVPGRNLSILPVAGAPFRVNTGPGALSRFSDAVPLGPNLYILKQALTTNGVVTAQLLRIEPNGQSTVIQDFASSGVPEQIGQITTFGTALLLTVQFDDGMGFFRSDGTAAGTVETDRIQDGSATRFLENLPGKALLRMRTSAAGRELWVTDGTTGGTTLLKDIRNGAGSSSPRGSVLLDPNTMLFHADDGTNGRELWKSDGTTQGTQLLKDVRPGPESGLDDELLVFDMRAWFKGDDGQTGKELWVTDGTSAGTKLFRDGVPGPSGTDPGDLMTLNLKMYYRGFDTQAGTELFETDGTVQGTRLVKDLSAGFASSFPYDLAPYDNRILMFGALDISVGEELFWSDGTGNGTALAFDLNPATARTPGSDPSNFVVSVNQAFFAARHPSLGLELYHSDGTPAGTSLVEDIRSGSAGSNVTNIAPLPDGRVLFSADDGSGQELHISDGTAPGTRRVKDIQPGSGSSNPGPFFMGTIDWAYFAADDGTNGRELHRTDGTGTGTLLAADIHAGSGSSDPGEFAYLPARGNRDDMLAMAADDGAGGRELFGLDLGTRFTWRIKDIRPGSSGSNPVGSVVIGGNVFFIADDGLHGDELWISDGTGAGTRLLKDIAAGSTPGLLRFGPSPVEFQGNLYFAAFDAQHGNELWMADGSSGQVQIFKDIVPGSIGATPRNLVVAHDKLFFTTQRNTSNGLVFDLWVSDGTAPGTRTVPRAGSAPTGLFPVGSSVYYSAVAAALPFTNQELWMSDGTRRGTFQVADIAPGFPGSRPGKYGIVNGALLFSADDGINGAEPWMIRRPGPTAEPIGMGCPTQPKLRVSPTTIGEEIEFVGTDAPPNSVGVLAFSGPLTAPWKLGGCWLYLDPSTLFILHAVTPVQGTWSHKIPVPQDPALLDLPALPIQIGYDFLGRQAFSNAVFKTF